MKLVRYGRAGAEKPGVIDAAGAVRDLSRVIDDITPDVLSAAGLKQLRGVKIERLPAVGGRPRLGAPLAGIGKMVCIGLNYSDHAREVGRPAPDEPTLFIKANSAINGPYDSIVRPPGATKLDYEVELAAVIGRDARNVVEADAMKTSPPTRSSTTSPSVRSRWSAAARRPRARARTPSHRSGRGSSPPTTSVIRRRSRCGRPSTASRASGATRRT